MNTLYKTADDWNIGKPWIDDLNNDIESYVKKVAHPEDYDLKAKLEYWREHGIAIFENAIDTSLLDLFEDDVLSLIQNPKDYEIEVDYAGKRQAVREVESDKLAHSEHLRINHIHLISRAAAHVSLNKATMSFLSHIFRDHPCVIQSLFFNKGSQQPIHLDYPYVCIQKNLACMAASWIPLEDVHEDSGPLAYYCGSHYPEKMPFYDWGNGNIVMDSGAVKKPMEFSNHLYGEMDRLQIKPKIFLPKRGDVLIWHAYLAHEGTAIRNPKLTRRSYVTHYCSLSAHPENHRKPGALEKGLYFGKDDGYIFEVPWDKNTKRLPSEKILS